MGQVKVQYSTQEGVLTVDKAILAGLQYITNQPACPVCRCAFIEGDLLKYDTYRFGAWVHKDHTEQEVWS